MPRGNGGVLGPANIPTTTVAKGVWSLMEQQLAQRQGIWPIVLSGDPYFEYTTLLLPGNGTNGAQNNTFLDGSTNNFTITRNGNTTQGTFSPFSQTGWGNYFGTTGIYLSVADNAALRIGTQDFWIEAWVFVTSYSAANHIINKRVYNNIGTGTWSFSINTSGAVVFNEVQTGAAIITTNNNAVPLNTWTHVAVSRDSSDVWRIFIDGTSSGTTAPTNNFDFSTTQPIIIGNVNDSNNWSFKGYISNLRFGIGSPNYTSNFVPSTTPLTNITNTVLLTCQSNRFVDNSTANSGTGFAITTTGSPSVQAFSPFNPSASWSAATYGGSGYFDGSGDYLSVASNAAFNLGTVFSVETFFYTTSTAKQVFFQLSGYVFYVESNKLTIWAPGSIGGTGADVPINSWAHIVFTRDSSNQARAFVNGVLAWSVSMTAASSQTIAYIGAENGSTSLVNGYMSNIRFVKGDIPTAYQTTSNTAGTTIFTPPTAPLTAITNTSLLLNFTNAGIYDATSKNDLETVGNAQLSNTTAKWGSTSIKFDGTGDYLTSNPATTDMYAFGSGDFTIEFWMYISVLGTSVPYDQRTTGGNGATSTLYITSSTLRYYVSGSDRITSSTLSTGQWYHVAVARSGTSTKMFIDGTQAGSTYTDSTVYTNSSLRPFIGGDSNNPGANGFNGYVQDLRITKGLARYTANFTPPTAAFPTL